MSNQYTTVCVRGGRTTTRPQCFVKEYNNASLNINELRKYTPVTINQQKFKLYTLKSIKITATMQ